MIEVSSLEFKVITKYIQDLCGIYLDSTKKYLIENRLTPILEELECCNYSELYFKAKADSSRRIPTKIIDAITTQETYFFRDKPAFILLEEKLLEEYFQTYSNLKPISIWSAGCSTGQEIYSIAITLHKYNPDMKVRLIATDISSRAIAKASYGKYNYSEISRGLSDEDIKDYFLEKNGYWQIRDEIRAMISFRKENLLQNKVQRRFDIVFCRYVAVYFEPPTQTKLLNIIADQLNPGGYLILGATESWRRAKVRYRRLKYKDAAYYQSIKDNSLEL